MFRKRANRFHVALLTLTETESFDTVLGAATSGVVVGILLSEGKQGSSATNLGSESNCKTSRGTWEMEITGPPLREEQIEWKDDNSS